MPRMLSNPWRVHLPAHPHLPCLQVRDEQLVEDIPPERMLEHDVPVDLIVTPTQASAVQCCPWGMAGCRRRLRYQQSALFEPQRGRRSPCRTVLAAPGGLRDS